MKQRLFVEIENAQWQHLRFTRPLEGFHAIARVVRLFEIVHVFLEPLVRVQLVKRWARLQDVDACISLVLHGLLHDPDRLLRVACINPRHEGGIQGDGDRERVERLQDYAGNLDGRDHPFQARGRRLALCKAIHHVIMNDVDKLGITPDVMDEMVTAFAIRATLSTLADDRELGVDGGYRQRDRHGAPVQAVEIIALEIMRELRCLADARHEDQLLRWYFELSEGSLHDLEDVKISTAGAPLNVD